MRWNPDAGAGNFSNEVTKDTELLTEKHEQFQLKEVWNGKLLHQMDGKKEISWNNCMKHIRWQVRRTLIPLRRAVKVNLDDLLGVGDLVPMSVGLPAFRNNLNQHAADGRLGDVRDALHVCLDVEFGFFVFD